MPAVKGQLLTVHCEQVKCLRVTHYSSMRCSSTSLF